MKNSLKGILSVFATAFFLFGASFAHAAGNVLTGVSDAGAAAVSIDSILADLRPRSTASQYRKFADAIQGSPALAAQLGELVRDGLLTRISIDSSGFSDERFFRANRVGSAWVFAQSFVEDQVPRRIYDVVSDDDILPNNMVFALGFMASRTKHDDDVTKAISALRELPITPTARMEQLVALNIRIDAGAFIQGWNDVVDAAIRQNRGIPLTAVQGRALMMNLRYRSPLLKAVTAASPDRKLRMESASIPYDAKNVEAMISALEDSQPIDILPMNIKP